MKPDLMIAALSSAALLLAAVPATAEEPKQEAVCSRPGFHPEDGVVARSETAERIFLAVETEIFPGADKETYPEVVVRDEGDYWSVFRHRPPEPPQPDGSQRIWIGGGQLSMRIAKCDGTISDVILQR